MGVLTSDEYYGKEKTGADGVAPVDQPVDYARLSYRFLFKPAKMGEANCGFIDNGKEYHFKLIDQIYEVPDDLPTHEKMWFQQLFVRNGFIDVSRAKNEEEVREIIQEPEIEKIYVYGHPDNSDDKKFTGNYAMYMPSGEEIKLKVKNGVVKTDRKEVALALDANGWYFVKEIPKDKEKQNE